MDLTQLEGAKAEEAKPNNSEPNLESSMYLESLGFVMDDGRPRFKLDEPVTTGLSTSRMMMSDVNSEDKDKTLSFVVLGKNSMDAIQSLSLASYVDIQQKSMAIDYNSMVSSLNTDEIQKKLMEVLQENMKLKETLKENNLAMKKQFNILSIWQEEMTKVLQNHKQKFAETKELINRLRQQNDDLKIKLSTQYDNMEHSFEEISKYGINDTSIDQTKLLEKISLLKEELANSKLICTKLMGDVKQYKDTARNTNTELESAQSLIKEQIMEIKKIKLESAVETSCNCTETCTKVVENPKCSDICEECLAKDDEVVRLKKHVALLMEKSQCIFTPIQLCDLSDSSFTQNRQKFVQNMKQYNENLQELIQCFMVQVNRYAVVEECLKKITDTLETFDDDKFYLNSQATESDSCLPEMQLYQCREKLHNYHKELTDELITIITERQILVRSQNQFQKMFSDYNTILYELEIMIDENAKLNALKDNLIRDNLRKQTELEKIMLNDKKSLEEKKIFNQEKNELEEEKRLFESQKKNLDMQHESLRDEKERLQQEKMNLNEEKISLDHQSQLYENHEKVLRDEKRSLQMQHEHITIERDSLRQNIRMKDIKLEELKLQLSSNMEEITLLKTQLNLFEEDFKQEKKIKELLMEEKSNLDVELQKQINFSKELQQDIKFLHYRRGAHHTPEYNNEASSTLSPCPKCETTLTSERALVEHIEECLKLK